jgi:HEAT repeat protein
MTDANIFFSEPLGLFWVLALWLLALFLGPAQKASLARATIALGTPRLVALDPDEAASASRLLGRVAADAMAELEHWQ